MSPPGRPTGDAEHAQRGGSTVSAAPALLGPGPVAVVGIGNMGLAMALRLRDAGMTVQVHDIDPARQALAAAAGCTPCAGAAEAAAGCALLIVAVVDDRQAEAVLFGTGDPRQPGATATLPAGATVLLCPTVGPDAVERISTRLQAAGLGWLEAPMSGGPVRARAGTMALMVAGPAALRQRWRPLLAHLAADLFEIGGRAGDGARTKLVNNLLAAVNLAGAAEALALAQQLGLDAAATLAVIQRSSGQSWIGADRLARALAGDFAPRAHTTLLAKDSTLALHMAAAAGLPGPPMGTAAAALFQQALAAGFGGEDDARLVTLLAQHLARRPPAGPAESAP